MLNLMIRPESRATWRTVKRQSNAYKIPHSHNLYARNSESHDNWRTWKAHRWSKPTTHLTSGITTTPWEHTKPQLPSPLMRWQCKLTKTYNTMTPQTLQTTHIKKQATKKILTPALILYSICNMYVQGPNLPSNRFQTLWNNKTYTFRSTNKITILSN